MNLQELRDRKGRLAEEANGILTAANGSMSKEQEQKFDAIHADIEKLNGQIARVEKQDALTVEMSASQGRRTATSGSAPVKDEFREFCMTGARTPEMQTRAQAAAAALGVGSHNAFVFAASGYQNIANTAEGGYTTQNELIRSLETARKAFGGARQFSGNPIRTSTGNPLPYPTINDTNNSGELLVEGGTVANAELAFGQILRPAYKFSSKAVTVSMELLQDSVFDFAALVGQRLGERIGRAENPYFTTGTGSAQPQGLVTGATILTGGAGVTLSVSNTSSETGGWYTLVDIEHSVDPAYRQSGNAKWSFSDGALKTIKKLTDGFGHPLWVPGLTSNAPDTILGYPYVINTGIADPALSAKSVVFGDASKFVIRDVQDIVIVRLNEIAALQGQVVFVAFSRSDSFVLDAGTHPITVWQQAAS